MKRIWLLLLAAMLLFATPALADDAGVLTETELTNWVHALWLRAASEEPLNAPVGEESRTEDGYAFLYSFATFYLDQPSSDDGALQAISVTDEALDAPRGIRLGADESMLMNAFGWQNPTLTGDESFAPLYVLNRLPEAAYWAWAQRVGDRLQSVRCAIHAQMTADTYTDTGILYTVTDGVVSDIRVYGLNGSVSRADVQSNLKAVGGNAALVSSYQPEGVTLKSDADAFSESDLRFGRVSYLTLTEKGAASVYGEPTADSWAADDNGAQLHTVEYAGATLVFSCDDHRENGVLESLTVTDDAQTGPRGLMLGARLDDVLALFRCDGLGELEGATALLYRDGASVGTLDYGDSETTLRYTASVKDGRTVSLRLSFIGGALAELMIYTL